MFKDEAEFEKVVGRLKVDTEPNPAHRENLRRQMLSVFNETTQPSQEPATPFGVFRRTIMKNTFTKIAAAIAVIAAVLAGLHFAGSPFAATPTFAQVIQPILNARTVVLDYVIGEGPDALEMHDIVIGSRIRRTMSNIDMTTIHDSRVRRTLSNMDTTMIFDLEDGRMLTLFALGVTKIACYVDIQGTHQESFRSVMDFVRNVVSEVKDNPDADIQDLGEKEINGQKAVGFYVKGLSSIELTIWANKKTSLPIRIEFTEGKTSTVTTVIKNIEFDVPLEESLVSMEVPAGYTLKDTFISLEVPAPDNLPEEQLDLSTLHLSNATEEDLVESLRIWAEIILDGAFPDAIGTDHFIKQAAVLGSKLASLGLPLSEMEQLCFKYTKGMLFLQEFEFGGKWGYAGKGVKLGDAKTPIFWYQPKGSATCRVIYGDLHVEDSSPEDLPLDKAEVDFTKGTEEDFIESLRILSKVLLDGMFPESISTEQYMKQMPLIGEKLAQSGLSKDEAEKLVMTLTRGMFFLQLLEIVDKYHYAGKGVKLGDAEKAIFWYQPEGVEKYRVIYGDLSVKDVAPENLPQ